MAAAVKLFEMGRFSSGQAAQLAGLSKKEFLSAARAWSVDLTKWTVAKLEPEGTS